MSIDRSKTSAVKLNGGKITTVVFISLLLDLLAFTMILPLLPSLLDYYKQHDNPSGLYQSCLSTIKSFQTLLGAPDYYHSVLFGGVLGSLFSFLQFVTSPIAGAFSDVYGRKPILLISLIGICFSYLIWVMAYDFRLFVLARVIGGLSKGNVSLIMAIITDVSTPSTRASGMAIVGIAFSIGFIVGPLIGAGFARWAHQSSTVHWFHYPATFALLLSLVDIFYIWCYFKETLPKEKRANSVAQSLGHAFSYINVASLFKFSSVRNLKLKEKEELSRLGVIYFVYLFVYSGLEFTLTFLTHHLFSYTPQSQGVMFLFIGGTMAVVQGAWVRRIPHHRVHSAASLGLLLIIPSFVLVGLAYNQTILYMGLFLFALSTSMVVPCMTTLASDCGGQEQKGTVMGVFRSLGALARAIGPLIASTAYWWLGSRITYLFGSVALIWPWLALTRAKISKPASKDK